MATIDERVVSLKFNNSQFEQGIKQSSESLKKFSSFPGLDGLRSGFEKIKGLFSGFSLSGMSSQVEQMTRQYLDARDGTHPTEQAETLADVAAWPVWVQPAVAHDSYPAGCLVSG